MQLNAKSAMADDVTVIAAMAAKSLTPTARTGAVYLTLENTSKTDLRVVKVSTEAAEFAEIHLSDMTDGVMKMRRVEELVLPALQTLDMQQENMHIMLVGLNAPLAVGGTVELQLEFAAGAALTIEAHVLDLADIAAHKNMSPGN